MIKNNINYDFLKLEPYLDIFLDVPSEYKEEVIEKFVSLFFIYMMDKNNLGVPMHNKIITKELYKTIKKDLDISQKFLDLVEKESERDDDFELKIAQRINNNKEMLNSKAVTKTMLKENLLKINKIFNLGKAFGIKEFIDNI